MRIYFVKRRNYTFLSNNLPERRDLDTRFNRGDRDMSTKLVIDPFTPVSPRLSEISSRLFVRA